MISTTRYGLMRLLLLAASLRMASLGMACIGMASIGMASIGMAPLAHAQALPSDQEDQDAIAETADVEDLEPDWSQLNVDTATLLFGPAKKPQSKTRDPKAADDPQNAERPPSLRLNGLHPHCLLSRLCTIPRGFDAHPLPQT